MEKMTTCRTAIGIAIQASKLLGRPYKYLKYTTLNEYYDINPEAHLDLTTAPDVKYFAIGRGGHKQTFIDKDNTPIMTTVNHETTNTGPFKGIPFVLRRINDDLTAEERQRYALRRQETHDGVKYWAYYLKRTSNGTEAPQVLHDNTKDGVTTTKYFQYTNDDLHPTPSDLPSVGTIVNSADVIRVSSRVDIVFDAFDTREYYKVNKILFGHEGAGIISEIMICAGVDQQTTVDSGDNNKIAFMEAVGVQVVTFVTLYNQPGYNNVGIHLQFDLWGGEPLLTKGETRGTRYSPDVKPSAEAETLKNTAYDASNISRSEVSTTASIAATKPTPPGDRQTRPRG